MVNDRAYFKVILFYILSACLIFLQHVQLNSQDKIRELAYGKEWLRIMHYKKALFGYKSRIENKKIFFISKEGQHDPYKELQANIKAFNNPGSWRKDLKQRINCIFPFRYKYLLKNKLIKPRDNFCPKLEAWKKAFRASKVYLLYASQYIANPSSVMGHTFFRFSSNRADYLDMTIGYMASVPPDTGTFMYIVKGLFGGFQGFYSIAPYYKKVQEYNNMESRDIWEYELNLSQEDRDNLLLHIWELLLAARQDYFFLDENCAYLPLAILETIRPDWELLNYFTYWVMPNESVKVLEKIGAVKSFNMRPSIRTRLLAKYDKLNAKQKKQFKILRTEFKAVDKLDDPQVLETLIEDLNYTKSKAQGKVTEKMAKLYEGTLEKRASLGSYEEPREDKEIIPSYKSQDPSMAKLSYGFSNYKNFLELGLRIGFHDLLNSDVGFITNSEIKLGDLKLRYYVDKEKFALDSLTLMSVYNFVPFSVIDFQNAWQFLWDIYTPKDFNCYDCLAMRFEPKIGVGFDIFNNNNYFYLLGFFNMEVAKRYKRKFRFGPGINYGYLYKVPSIYKLHLNAKLIYDMLQSERQKLLNHFVLRQALIFTQNFDLTLEGSYIPQNKKEWDDFYEAKLSFNYYF